MDERWTTYLMALAKPDQPRATFAALEAITKAVVGTKLFTAMTHDTTAKRSLRVYSGNEQAYPTGGWKPLRPGPWTERVIERRRVVKSHEFPSRFFLVSTPVRISQEAHDRMLPQRFEELGFLDCLNELDSFFRAECFNCRRTGK